MTKRQIRIMVCAICLALLLHFNFVPEARSFDGADLLAQQIPATSIKGGAIDQVLGILTSDYGIPIGIVLGDERTTPRREIDLNLPETTVKDFLDAIIGEDPRYTWKLEGGVIHVRPSTGSDAFLTTLLATRISHFGFSEDSTRYAIFSDILKVPEIQTKLIVPMLHPWFSGWGRGKESEWGFRLRSRISR